MSRIKGGRFKETLSKKDVIDIITLIVCALFAITIIYQITFIQSTQNNIRDLGILALGIAVLSFVGISLVSLFSNIGVVEFLNFKKEYHGASDKKEFSLGDMIKRDTDFQKDFLNIFLIGLIVQVGFSFIYGGFAGSAFDLSFQYDLNAVLLIINTAVGEELFFSLFLAAVSLSLCKEMWHVFVAGLINVLGFIAVHMIVYGTTPEAALYIVVLRIIYFYMYYKTRRVSLPILLHALNNFLFISTILFI